MDWPGRIGPTDEITLEEAAELLHVSPVELLKAVETGALPARTNGSVVTISVADVHSYRIQLH
jgi:excisionase family DNA binding protein